MTELDDYIQKAVNEEYEQAIKRYQKKIEYKISQGNRKRKINRKRRKMERYNRKKGRQQC